MIEADSKDKPRGKSTEREQKRPILSIWDLRTCSQKIRKSQNMPKRPHTVRAPAPGEVRFSGRKKRSALPIPKGFCHNNMGFPFSWLTLRFMLYILHLDTMGLRACGTVYRNSSGSL
jgi:hypothetical protein